MQKFILLAVLSCGASFSSYSIAAAGNSNAETLSGIIESGGEIGYGIYRMTVADMRTTVPPGIPVDSVAAENILNKLEAHYRAEQKNKIGADLLGANSKLVVRTLAAGLTIGSAGSAAPWIALGEHYISGIIDSAIETKKDDIEEKARAYIASHKADLVEAFQTHDFSKDSFEEIEKKIENIDSLERDLKERFPGPANEEARELARGVIAESVKELALEGIRRTEINGQEIETLKNDFTNFVAKTVEFHEGVYEKFKSHEGRLDNLDKAVDRLDKAMGKVNSRLKQQGNELSIVSDFVFKEMSAADKVKALDRGLFASRFDCREGMKKAECSNRKKTKEDLIEAYSAEAEVELAVAEISKFARDSKNISMIANNLGIDIPLVGDIEKYSGVAADVANKLVDQNYLGAAASVTGLFRKRSDAAAARHKQMIKYLQREFARVNQKLDNIIKTQERIIERLNALSTQIQEHHRLLNERLDVLTFETNRISENVLISIMGDWGSCFTIENIAFGTPGFDQKNKDFESLEALFAFRQRVAGEAVECIDTARTKISTIHGSDFFGNILSVSNVLQNGNFKEVNLNAARDDARYVQKSALQTYVRDIYAPIIELIDIHVDREKNNSNWSEAFLRLSHPSLNLLENEHNFLDPCPTSVPKASANKLICEQLNEVWDQRNPDAISKKRLKDPVSHQMALRLSRWVLIASRLSDIRDTRKNGIDFYKNKEELFRNGTNGTQSIYLLEGAEQALTYAIASKAMIAGRPTVEATYDAILFQEDKKLRSSIFSLLKSNVYLRYNVMMKALHESLSIGTKSPSGLPTIRDWTYNLAMEVVLNDPVNEVRPLESIFSLNGNLFRIRYNLEENWPEFCFLSEEGIDPICSLMPTKDAFAKAELEFPISLYRLIARREDIRARIIEYNLISNFTEEERRDLVSMMLH